MFLLAAISLGFLGSFHCIGMCGPIALAIPVKRNSILNVISGSLIYNFGRIITYACIGLIFGIVGKGFALAGWQNILSVTLGVAILFSLFITNRSIVNTGMVLRLLEKLKSHLRKLFGIHRMRSLLLIGLLNGLLPCGLVYLAIAGAIAGGEVYKGALFMIAFGLGTVPAMISISLVRNHITIRFRERIRKAVPIFVGIMAVLLILRGSNLGIPYISPSIETTKGLCHHQCCDK